MRSSALRVLSGVLMLVAPLLAQGKRLWVLRSSGEMVEYDPATFAANQTRRLQRESIDLSTSTTWQAWTTDLSGAGRQDLITSKFPDCRCETGTCEETCFYGTVWVSEGGVERVFLMMQFIAGQTEPTYGASTRYREEGGKWTAQPLSEALERVLDVSADGSVIIESIPDSGCCGWVNESNDQTLVLSEGKKHTLFDERATYKNSD